VQGWDEVCGCTYVREGGKWEEFKWRDLAVAWLPAGAVPSLSSPATSPTRAACTSQWAGSLSLPHFYIYALTHWATVIHRLLKRLFFPVVAITEPCLALRLSRREDSRHGKPVLFQQISQWTKGRSSVTIFKSSDVALSLQM